MYRIIQFPRPVKFKEVVQKVTDAFGQTMDLVSVNNEVLFPLLLRGSFGGLVPTSEVSTGLF